MKCKNKFVKFDQMYWWQSVLPSKPPYDDDCLGGTPKNSCPILSRYWGQRSRQQHTVINNKQLNNSYTCSLPYIKYFKVKHNIQQEKKCMFMPPQDTFIHRFTVQSRNTFYQYQRNTLKHLLRHQKKSIKMIILTSLYMGSLLSEGWYCSHNTVKTVNFPLKTNTQHRMT